MTNKRELSCAERVAGMWETTKAALDRFMNDTSEDTYEEFRNYASSFDYVAPGTFSDRPRGYWRYQMMAGGPSDEIIFYGEHHGHRVHLEVAQYWFKDWFDGAFVDVTNEPCVKWLFEDLAEIGSVSHAYEQSIED